MTVRPVRSAANVLVVIEAIATDQPVGVSQLARTTGLDKSLVQRLLTTLHDSGWIMPASGTPRRWQLSSKPLSLLRMTRPIHLLELASAEMLRLREELNETVIIAAPQAGKMVIVDLARTETPLRVEAHPQFAFSPTSASAVAFLAALPAEQEADFLELREDVDFRERVAIARQRGYATLESEESVVLASAMRDESNFPFATLAIVAPRFRLAGQDLDELGKKVAESARRCSAALA